MELDLYKNVTEINKRIYSDFSFEYENRTRNAYKNYLKPFIDEFILALQGDHIFDLGCGPGRDLSYFKDNRLQPIGVDISEGMIAICKNKGLSVVHNDFLNMNFEPYSVDGFWAYTSHTVIPKSIFKILMQKYCKALKPNSGVLALGMIEGTFEGYKSDGKYQGAKRYVARYSKSELESILRQFFGSVKVESVNVCGKTYLHSLCWSTAVPKEKDTVNAAKELFDKFSDQYKNATLTGIKLLESDRRFFVGLLKEICHEPRIIDIGCGPGRDLIELSKLGACTTGIDISKANVDNCKKQNMNAIIGDIYNLKSYLLPNSFEGAWCNCSVTNWVLKDRLLDIIESIKQIVIPNGYIFIGSVLGNFSGWEINEKYDSLKRYNNHWSRDKLLSILSKIGTKIYEKKLENTGKKDYINLVYKNDK